MPLTHFAHNKILAKAFGGTDFTPPANFYVALFTVAPTVAGGGTEVAGGSYARAGFVNNTTNLPAPASGQTATTLQVTMPTPTASWGSIVAVGIYDASTAGNLWAFYTLPTPRAINTGDNYAFPIGNIIIRLAAA